MPILTTTRWNFADVAARTCKDMALVLGNSLAQNLTVINDLVLVEGTSNRSNTSAKYLTLGGVSKKRANQGIVPSKASVVQENDPIVHLMTRIEIEEDVWNDAPDKDRLLADELGARAEALRQQMSFELFYGDANVDIDTMNGIAPRLNRLTQATVVSAGGSSANTSIYILTHNAAQGVYAFYPRGTTAGLATLDRGNQERFNDASGNGMYGKVIDLSWKMGIGLKNDRQAARVCNIATGSLSKTGANSGGSGADLEDLIVQAQMQMQNSGDSTRRIYANRAVNTYLARQFQKKSNHWVTREEFEGAKTPLLHVNGLAIFMDEAITNNEGTIS